MVLHTFGYEQFGHGVILSSRCLDDFYTAIASVRTYLPCFDDRRLLELHTYAPRGVYMLKIYTCRQDDAGLLSTRNLTVILTGKQPGDSSFVSTPEVPIGTSGQWFSSEAKVFSINIEQQLSEVTLLTLVNSNDEHDEDHEDAMCVDSISIDGVPALSFSSHWIGSGRNAESTWLVAVCVDTFVV